MKKEKLQELVRHITRLVLKEYGAMDNSGVDTPETNSKADSVPLDQLSSAEQAKMKKEKDITRRDTIKQKQKELDVVKKKMDYQKQEIDQTKRFEVPNLTKQIQTAKGAKMEESSPERMPSDSDPNVQTSDISKIVQSIFGDQWQSARTQRVDKNWIHSFIDYTGKNERLLFVCLKDMELYYAYSGDKTWKKHNKNGEDDRSGTGGSSLRHPRL